MSGSAPALLDRLGGEEGLRTLVETFYDLIESVPEARDIHRLHFRGHGVAHTRGAQVEFMSGFMGGRAYYRERHGHMDLREIHAHVPIRACDAEVWLAVWDQALDACGHRGKQVDAMRQTVRRAAFMLVNDVPDWRVHGRDAMIRFMCAIGAAAFAATALQAQAVKLTGDEIRALLTGNTAIGRWEGAKYRQYFGADGVTIYAQEGARSTRGDWRVDDAAQEYQSIWPRDADWEGWFVMEFGDTFYWVSKTTPPTPFQVLDGQQLVTE